MRRAVLLVRQGPGLAEARATSRVWLPRIVDAVQLEDTAPRVILSTRELAAVPDALMPAGLPALRDAFGAAGWTWEVGYSRAVLPAVRYVATARGGKAGQVRTPAREVTVVTLRVRRPWIRAYGSWTDRRWSGGACVSTSGGWRALGTVEVFRSLIELEAGRIPEYGTDLR